MAEAGTVDEERTGRVRAQHRVPAAEIARLDHGATPRASRHRPANIRKMMWLMPRMAKAVPYLGYIVVAGPRPA